MSPKNARVFFLILFLYSKQEQVVKKTRRLQVFILSLSNNEK